MKSTEYTKRVYFDGKVYITQNLIYLNIDIDDDDYDNDYD